MIRKFGITFFITDIVIITISILMGGYIWILNTQVAFVSAMLITVGSYLGYKKNIQLRVEDMQNRKMVDMSDECNKIDDKFNLHKNSEVNNKKFSKEDIIQIFQDEKKELKNQNTTMNTLKSISGITSLYRIAGYSSLIFGFFYLNNNSILVPIAYLTGFIVVPISVLLSKFIKD
jgi:hypothetical protein